MTKLLGNRVAVSPIVTVEPRRRKFHKPITLTIPLPQAATRGMINQYNGDAPTLRLLCSITGGQTKAQWEDVTGSTPLTFLNDCVSFTTTVSARFWLMDCRQLNEATKFATEVYKEAIHVPFMVKFVVFAKRLEPMEAQIRVFCMTDDKEEKTLEQQEHFTEVAKSRDVEVLERKPQFVEFAGNLIPVSKSGEQLSLTFQAFHENRLPFTARLRDAHQEPIGRIAFMKEPRKNRADQTPICNLNLQLPEVLEMTADELQLRHSPFQPYKKDGFDSLRDDIGSRGTSRGASRDELHYEDRDIMKVRILYSLRNSCINLCIQDPESFAEDVLSPRVSEVATSPRDLLDEKLVESQASILNGQREERRHDEVAQPVSETASPTHGVEADRAEAVQNMLSFLEKEDEEESSTRARDRGESVSAAKRDLYVTTEQVPVPIPVHADDTSKSRNYRYFLKIPDVRR